MRLSGVFLENKAEGNGVTFPSAEGMFAYCSYGWGEANFWEGKVSDLLEVSHTKSKARINYESISNRDMAAFLSLEFLI